MTTNNVRRPFCATCRRAPRAGMAAHLSTASHRRNARRIADWRPSRRRSVHNISSAIRALDRDPFEASAAEERAAAIRLGLDPADFADILEA